MKKLLLKFLFVCLFVHSCALAAHEPACAADNRYRLTGRPDFTPAEVRAWAFLHNKMLDASGVIYYLVDPKKTSKTGVFESMGQAMEYLALIGDADLFARYAKVTDQYYRDKEGYYYWEIAMKGKKGSKVTALIDDIRLFRAYHTANRKSMGNYTAKLKQLAGEIFTFDTDKNGYAIGYYSKENNEKAPGVDLFYLDTATMSHMTAFDERWKEPLKKTREILARMPENKFGFYPIWYDIAKKKYTTKPSVNMVENLYTGIFAKEAGKTTKRLAAFLKKQIEGKAIYNHYTQQGKPVDKNESTAVYALAARFLDLNGEKDAALWCYNKMLVSQIGVDSRFIGGFSMDDSEAVYAFDQLEALLTLRSMRVK